MGKHSAPRTRRMPLGREHLTRRLPVVGAAAALAAVATVGASNAEVGGEASAALTASHAGAAVADQAGARGASAEDAARVLADRQNAAASRSAARERERRLEEARKLKAAKAAREARIKAAKAKKAAAEKKAAAIAQAQSDPKGAALALMGDYGFDASQFSCLETLWTGESSWNYKARNASSGAYGIPQALPASKFNTVGADWLDNPVTQIKWGLQYIKERYGSPCNALGFWQSQSPRWY